MKCFFYWIVHVVYAIILFLRLEYEYVEYKLHDLFFRLSLLGKFLLCFNHDYRWTEPGAVRDHIVTTSHLSYCHERDASQQLAYPKLNWHIMYLQRPLTTLHAWKGANRPSIKSKRDKRGTGRETVATIFYSWVQSQALFSAHYRN